VIPLYPHRGRRRFAGPLAVCSGAGGWEPATQPLPVCRIPFGPNAAFDLSLCGGLGLSDRVGGAAINKSRSHGGRAAVNFGGSLLALIAGLGPLRIVRGWWVPPPGGRNRPVHGLWAVS